MKISDAELLDTVRKLRAHMATMDNVHSALNAAQDIDDAAVVKQVQALLLEIPPITLKIAQTLRNIESTRQYRDMIKKFNIKEDEEDDG